VFHRCSGQRKRTAEKEGVEVERRERKKGGKRRRNGG
jgi:hypothetical protein